MNVKSKVNFRGLYDKAFFVSLSFMILLFSSCFVSAFSGVSSFALGTSDRIVSNELELRNAVDKAVGSTVIALGGDISLMETIDILAYKCITLTSVGGAEFRLIGACDQTTININNHGELTLDGIIVTHESGKEGSGVTVDAGGVLFLSGGEISGNTAYFGGGVSVAGSFSMSGGAIFNNTVYGSGGGGVYLYQYGIFNLIDGMISENRVYRGHGGGVCNFHGVFSMSGGVISGNTVAEGDGFGGGGGVANRGGVFSMSGGVISDNKAGTDGGGVWIDVGMSNRVKMFSMSGGVISGNAATDNGGGVYIHEDTCNVDYVLSGGEISGNSAVKGGGVYYEAIFNPYISYHCFEMSGGVICGNTAFQDGGGVYVRRDGVFSVSGGEISSNSAAFSGGGVWIDVNNLGNLSIADGVIFSNNRASEAYARDPLHDELYRTHISDRVSWSSPFTQGYNNYDISYTSGTLVSDRGIGSLGFIVILILIIGIVIGSLFFYFRKKKRRYPR